MTEVAFDRRVDVCGRRRTRGFMVAAAFAAFGLAAGGCDAVAPRPPSAPAPGRVPALPTTAKKADLPPPPGEIYKVPLNDSPARGGTAAKVTLVAFSEFQCPFCGRVEPTLAKLSERYGDDLRIVWKHMPLQFHDRAVPAALAAEAARVQDKFWPMHDRLFAQQGALGQEDLLGYARALGLDLGRFTAALSDPAIKARIDADAKLADTLGVRGTPSFFINGRRLVGAQPVDRFVAVIDEELVRADGKLRAGVAPAQLYAALTEGGLEKMPAPDPTAAAPSGHAAPAGEPDPTRDLSVTKFTIGDAPVRGPANAPVTVVVFSDFQCPFCKKVEGTIDALEKAYPGKVKVAWKHFPLDFHANARMAAAAAQVAHRSGKFWAMHDQLLAHQEALDPESLAGYARDVGLDPSAFKAALAEADAGAAIDADVKLGTSIGVTGTPTLFINGRRIVGAYPLETVRAIVDQELKKRGG
jgi:protein-disulfide isomerase